ncbi:CLUMA_CG004653, isoform A [Clunio marinus]|uniref:CLUMA_CG004653, isoform A n=1 Tax=Clunio marinus TaxID=568069 RepID=A0A1J1HSI5_9DIPT|nr:CLUMA_CG004653, isoform A [Clunio marinus]
MAMVKAQIPEGYATIRRSTSRARKLRTASTTSHDNQPQFEMIEMNERNSISRKYESDILYNNRQNNIYDDAGEVDEGVINDIETDRFYQNNDVKKDYFGDSQRTFQTFKPPTTNGLLNDMETSVSSKDLRQSNEHFQSLPYDLLMSPLKSPHYINQLNAMRNNKPIGGDAAAQRQKQFPLYARPDSPQKYGKGTYNRSTSPSADSMDNCSSNSSTYSSAYRQPSSSVLSQDDENLVLININNDVNSRKPPMKNTNLSYRKSFSHINRTHQQNGDVNGNRKFTGSFSNNRSKAYNTSDSQEFINYEKPSISTLTMTKPLGVPSISTSNLYTRQRFATLSHPKEKQLQSVSTKSTSSLNENHVFRDPILDSKIGSQTTLRTKPIVPWWELACKKEHRQSCPPMQESEITDMRQTIELLKKQSIQAGLTSAHMQSMGVQVNGKNGSVNSSPTKKSLNGSHETGLQNGNGTMQRHHSTDSVCSINSISSSCSGQDKKKKKGWLRSSFTKAFTRSAKISKTPRETSLNESLSESKSSLPSTPQKLPPKLPSTYTLPDYGKPPISPTKSSHRHVTLIENAKPVDSIEIEAHPVVEDLKKQLREKDMVLTDIRLEALTQASQMETLKETVKAMRQEMMALKQNNERLQKMVTTRSLGGSETSIGCPASPLGSGCDSRRYSFATDSGHSRPPLDLPQNLDETEEEDNIPPAPAPTVSPHLMSDLSPTLERISLSNEILTTPAEEVADPVDGKKITIAVFLGQSEVYLRYVEELNGCERFDDEEDGLQTNGDTSTCFSDSQDDPSSSKIAIAYTYISGKTTWQNLDYIVRKTFKDYLSKIDPGTNLGLNTDSIISYHLGEAKRGPEMGFPELLPCGYIVGNVKTLYICLQGVGSLAFDTLIPRSIVHRYINLLTEHRRLILCGPSGTGKSHLARKLAEFLVAKSNRSSPAESIATFNVDHKSSKELQQYLSHIAEQASIAVEELPEVIILDNLHHASALGDVFSCLLSAGPATKLPCIIGTMSQATCNTTNLQLHHNFRWVLTANHMEPVKGFLGRYLRRRLYDIELLNGSTQVQMEKIFRWLPTVFHHINSFLETHSSSDVTIGPQLFLECPIDVNESQKWFVELWNNNLAPYLVEAIKEGVQLYGRRGNGWIDPCQYVRETYPWPVTPTTVPKLRTITAEDVGLEAELSGNKEDPLLNMLNQLKEAASWNEGQQDDSDCVSLDSNFTHDSSLAEA